MLSGLSSGPSQYLAVYLPSPTTVSFTVTTRRPESSKFRATLRTLLRHTCRVLLIYLAILVNVVKARENDDVVDSNGTDDGNNADYFLDAFLKFGGLGTATSLVKPLTERCEWWILAGVGLLVIYSCLRRDYVGGYLSHLCRALYVSYRRHYSDCFLSVCHRRITSSPTRTRDPNQHEFSILFHRSHDDVHPHDPDSRHCHPRSLQGFGGTLLLGSNCRRGDRSGGGVSSEYETTLKAFHLIPPPQRVYFT